MHALTYTHVWVRIRHKHTSQKTQLEHMLIFTYICLLTSNYVKDTYAWAYVKTSPHTIAFQSLPLSPTPVRTQKLFHSVHNIWEKLCLLRILPWWTTHACRWTGTRWLVQPPPLLLFVLPRPTVTHLRVRPISTFAPLSFFLSQTFFYYPNEQVLTVADNRSHSRKRKVIYGRIFFAFKSPDDDDCLIKVQNWKLDAE